MLTVLAAWGGGRGARSWEITAYLAAGAKKERPIGRLFCESLVEAQKKKTKKKKGGGPKNKSAGTTFDLRLHSVSIESAKGNKVLDPEGELPKGGKTCSVLSSVNW